MYYLDTNIILRYIIGDGGELFNKSVEIFSKIDSGEIQVEIPVFIAMEIIFVLEKFYDIPTHVISDHLRKVYSLTGIINTDIEELIYAIKLYEIENIDFADALLVATHSFHDIEILSFDNKINTLIKQ